MDKTVIIVSLVAMMILIVMMFFLKKWLYADGDVEKDSTSNSGWLQKKRRTVTTLVVADTVWGELESVFQEIRKHHPEIPASDPGEEEIKKLCKAFVARMEEHVDYWNRQPDNLEP